MVTQAYKANGELWAWGQNNEGQLGDGTQVLKNSPVRVIGSHNFIIVSEGSVDAIALKQDGSAWTWGTGLGIGDNTTTRRTSPVQVVGNHTFIDCDAGHSCRVALKADGSAWTWGQNSFGQLGTGNITHTSSPVQVIGNHSFISVRAGGDWQNRPITMAALKADGSLWGWGVNDYGILGTGDTLNYSSPVVVVGNHSFIDFAVGKGIKCALKADGSLWCWGNNQYGTLGTGDLVNKTSPVQVIGNHSFIKVAIGGRHEGFYYNTCAALKADGSVWTWGYGTGLGDGILGTKSSPVQVIGNHSFIEIMGGVGGSSGPYFCGLKANGSIWGWGGNGTGQLGTGDISNRSSPTVVIGNHSFISIHAGLKTLINVNGVWIRDPIGFINVNGVWKRILRQKVSVGESWKNPKFPV